MGHRSVGGGRTEGLKKDRNENFCPLPPRLSPLSVGAADGPTTVMENLQAAPDPGRKEAGGLQEMTLTERQRKESH